MEVYKSIPITYDYSTPATWSRLRKTILVGLMATVVFTALAHGTVEPWSVAFFEVAVVLLVLLCAFKIVASEDVAIYIPGLVLPLAALLGLALLQSLAFADGSGRNWSLSVDVEATRASVLGLSCLLFAFLIAANLFSTREQFRCLAWFLVIYGTSIAIFALIQHFTWNGRFYWLRTTTVEQSLPFGPFVNRNHFAGYMELLLPFPVALVITGAVRRDARYFMMLAAGIMGAAAMVSLSRGGMISIAAEMIFMTVVGFRRRTHNPSMSVSPSRGRHLATMRPVVITILVAVIIGAGILWIGSEPVINRLVPGQTGENSKSETFYSSRGWIWQDTISMIRANPIVGVGLGAYESAYPIYSRDDGSRLFGESFSVDRAHNDYLQILADCGIVGGALALLFIGIIFRSLRQGLRTRDPLLSGIALGGGSAIFGMLVHSFFDFNLQLPSNALLFLVLAAVVSRVGALCADSTRRTLRAKHI